MLTKVEQEYPTINKSHDDPNDTSKVLGLIQHYHIPGFKGRFGFITSMSDHFCGTCNRLRVLADGNMKVCLFGNTEVNLRDVLRRSSIDDELVTVVSAAGIGSLDTVKRKKKQHAGMSELSKLPNRPMILIGG